MSRAKASTREVAGLALGMGYGGWISYGAPATDTVTEGSDGAKGGFPLAATSAAVGVGPSVEMSWSCKDGSGLVNIRVLEVGVWEADIWFKGL